MPKSCQRSFWTIPKMSFKARLLVSISNTKASGTQFLFPLICTFRAYGSKVPLFILPSSILLQIYIMIYQISKGLFVNKNLICEVFETQFLFPLIYYRKHMVEGSNYFCSSLFLCNFRS